MTERNNLLPGILAIVFLLALAFVVTVLPPPPAPLPLDAPLDQFSAMRAVRHIAAIAQEPRPTGSAANARARQYILDELGSLGLEVQVQEANTVSDKFISAAQVTNLLARLPGKGQGKAILLAAHHDSVTSSPGASDDGSGVATLLETARALQNSLPLENDVIFLFTDAEEVGLLGAQAFVDEHPWVGDVGLVLNFEARGNSGPVFAFETSPHNGWLIPEFAKAVPYPAANSLMYEIYQIMPNDTDFTIFKEAGLAGFNFGYIAGTSHYHTALDKVENLDLRSLQHDGSYALSLTRHFGDLDLDTPTRSNQVYFSLPGWWMVYYPGSWVVPLAGLAVLFYIGVVVLGMKHSRVTVKGLVLGFLGFLLAVALSAILALVLWQLVIRLKPEQVEWDILYIGFRYWVAFVALAFCLNVLLYRGYLRKLGLPNVVLGAHFGWLVLVVAVSLMMPGASFLFLWPLVFSLVGQWLIFWLGEKAAFPWWQAGLRLVFAIPAVVLVAPLVYNFFIALSAYMLAAPVVVLALLLGLLIPLLEQIERPAPLLLPAVSAVVGIGFLGAAFITPAHTARFPQADMIFYGLDATEGRAYWIASNSQDDPWVAKFVSPGAEIVPAPEFMPNSTASYARSPAPVLELPAPRLELREDHLQEESRRLVVLVSSPREAGLVRVFVASSREIEAITLAGQPLKLMPSGEHGAEGYLRYIEYWNPPIDGFELQVMVSPPGPVRFTVVDYTFELPVGAGFPGVARPVNTMSLPRGISDATLVSGRYDY